MPQYNSVVLADGQATPVNHTYTVQSVKPDLISLIERIPATPMIGCPELTIRHRAPLKGRPGVFREEFTLRVPTLNTTAPSTATGVQPVPSVGYECQLKLSFLVSDRATEQEKKNLRRYASSLISNAALATQVESSEGIWA